MIPTNNSTCIIKKRKTLQELMITSIQEFLLISFIIYTISYILYKFNINPYYFYALIGLFTSIYATYIKWKIKTDPNYMSLCNCAHEGNMQDIEADVIKVLMHKKGSILFDTPNSTLGICYYLFYIIMLSCNMNFILNLMAISSCIGGLYLWYIMVTEIRSVCILCMTIHSVNALCLSKLIY